MSKTFIARWRTTGDNQDFDYLSEVLELENGTFTLKGRGWMNKGLFGHVYGQQIAGSESNGITLGTREYRLTKQQAATWLYWRERDDTGYFKGNGFDEVFPNTDVPGKPEPSDYPEREIREWYDREGIFERFRAWDGENVRDIYDDVADILDRGDQDGEDLQAAEDALNDRSTGLWPEDLAEWLTFFAIDRQQRALVAEKGQRAYVTLHVKDYSDMVTRPVLKAMRPDKLLKWYADFRGIADHLDDQDRERYQALVDLSEDADVETIRTTALSLITDIDWLPDEWGSWIDCR